MYYINTLSFFFYIIFCLLMIYHYFAIPLRSTSRSRLLIGLLLYHVIVLYVSAQDLRPLFFFFIFVHFPPNPSGFFSYSVDFFLVFEINRALVSESTSRNLHPVLPQTQTTFSPPFFFFLISSSGKKIPATVTPARPVT